MASTPSISMQTVAVGAATERTPLLLVEAVTLLVLIGIALRVLPFRWLRTAMRHLLTDRPCGSATETVSVAVGRAVTAARNVVPGTRCLAEALAFEVMLRRRSQPVRLHVGVRAVRPGELLFHAWVDQAGTVVHGGMRANEHYRPVPLTCIGAPRNSADCARACEQTGNA
jgi:hypothetical protein